MISKTEQCVALKHDKDSTVNAYKAMKIIHLSDLHLGKRIYEVSMIEDQRFVLNRIIEITEKEKPDVVVIAGDVYDKPIPSEEAVELFNGFLEKLSEKKVKTMIISGNHDSAERLSFGRFFMKKSDIYISDVYNGNVDPVVLKDDIGDVYFYLLPFIKTINVKHFYPDEEINTTTEALKVAVDKMNIDKSRRNVLVAHQFVTGAERSESEEIFVGGADNVDSCVFEDFDYVALGHIHRSQNIKSGKIRYCGTPLKYSFSESKHDKSVSIVEIREKGVLNIREVPLKFLHDLTELKGTYAELMDDSNDALRKLKDSYLHITLTDEDEIPNAKRNLDSIYNNIMLLDYDNSRTRHFEHIDAEDNTPDKTPLQLFAELYERQNGTGMTENQYDYAESLIKEIWEG